MTILSAQSIQFLCRNELPPVYPTEEYPHYLPPAALEPMIYPFFQKRVTGGMSWGLSCASYDVRLAQDLWLPPKTMRLASTIEKFAIPKHVAVRVHDKSSWARKAVHVHNTFIDPGWRGYLTLEIFNGGWGFRRLKMGTPIAQLVFEFLDEPTVLPYAGKYQNQDRGPQPARDEPTWNTPIVPSRHHHRA